MKTLTIGIALATLICSPAFATPVDAVTAGGVVAAGVAVDQVAARADFGASSGGSVVG